MYQYDTSSTATGMAIWELTHNGTQYSATEVTGLRNLLTYHGFSMRITGKTGIRIKTGIDGIVRQNLLSSGVGGYTLKEYGTLVLPSSYLAQYPLVKDGAMVRSGLSYGYDTNGTLQDKYFEIRNGRYRFTSVLVDIAVSPYKTEYAFRGYITLTKNGQDYTFHGPIAYRSSYNLANQVIASGQYEVASSADIFLKQIIADADGQS